MKVHVCNHTRKDIQVHRIGCADIQRDKKRRLLNSDWMLTVPDGKSVAAAVVDDLNGSFCWDPKSGDPAPWSEGDVRIMPCCKDIGKGTAASDATIERLQGRFNRAAKAQQKKEKVMNIKAAVKKNDKRVRAAMQAAGVVLGEAMTPAQMQKLQDKLNTADVVVDTKGMTFNLFTDKTKKAKRTLHTPSCKAGDRLKKRASFKKVIAATADDAAHVEGKNIVFGTDGEFIESDIKIHSCCKLFRKVKTSNPPCPHCGNTKTVFRSNIGVGKGKKSSEFTCTGCKKMFVHSKPKKEKVMKIKIAKQDKGSKKTARKGSDKNDRAAKRAEKRQARMEARKAKREQKKADRLARREERKQVRVGRMFDRAAKFLDRMEKQGIAVKDMRNALGVARQDAGLAPAKKAKRGSKK